MGELQEEPRHTAKTTITDITITERGHQDKLRLNFCITEHGWIGAGGSPVEHFLCLICAPVFVPFYTGHSLRTPSCMKK